MGKKITLYPHGEIDSLVLEQNGERTALPFTSELPVTFVGEATLTPYKNGQAGAPVTLYGYESIYSLYKKPCKGTITLPYIQFSGSIEWQILIN